MKDFSSSFDFDKRLFKEEILQNQVYVKALRLAGVLNRKEHSVLQSVLGQISKEGVSSLNARLEDVHTSIEEKVSKKAGAVMGGKLRTGRSRNDQVATSTRMAVKSEIKEILSRLHRFQEVLLRKADRHKKDIMPGYTHLQPAETVTLGLHLMAYFFMFQRDKERFINAYKQTDCLPLGAGALAGTFLKLDRYAIARELGFSKICANSMDAVSDRDFAAEVLFCSALCMVHLSRSCEELVLWSNPQFAFVSLSDSFCTGSSFLPQKKNPDAAELIRGKVSGVTGDMVALLMLLKGLPLTYNRDLQEDKKRLFESLDTLKQCLKVMAEMFQEAQFIEKNLKTATQRGYPEAVDLAHYLVQKGMPFQRAHNVVGELIRVCEERNLNIASVDLNTLSGLSPLFGKDVYGFLRQKASRVQQDVKRQISLGRKILSSFKAHVSDSTG